MQIEYSEITLCNNIPHNCRHGNPAFEESACYHLEEYVLRAGGARVRVAANHEAADVSGILSAGRTQQPALECRVVERGGGITDDSKSEVVVVDIDLMALFTHLFANTEQSWMLWLGR